MDLLQSFKNTKLGQLLNTKGATTSANNDLYRALYSTLIKNNVEFYDKDPEVFIGKGYTFNPHAYTVINFIARSMSQVPFNVFEVSDRKHMDNYMLHKSMNDFAGTNYYREKALTQVEGTGLNKILQKPNEFQGFQEFLFESIGYMELTGNRFVYGLSPTGFSDELFSSIYNMPSQLVEIVGGNFMTPVQAYKLYVTNDRTLDMDFKKVLHQKEWNPSYDSRGISPYGLSPMQPLLKSLQRSNQSYEASLKLLENGIPAGIMSNNSDLVMTPEQLDTLEDAYRKKFGGGKNKNKVLFSASQVSWQEIGMKSQDMELLASNMADLRDFCRVYGIPTMLVSDTENSTFNNVTEAKKSVWMEKFIPKLDGFRDGLNSWLTPAWSKKDKTNYFIDYDLTRIPVLQVDLDKLSARLMKEMEQGMWNPNEVRSMLGKELGVAVHLDKYMLGSRFDFVDKEGKREERPRGTSTSAQGVDGQQLLDT